MNNSTINKDKYSNSWPRKVVFSYAKKLSERFILTENTYYNILKNSKIVNYFKRFYPLQRLSAVENFVIKSKYYNKSFVDQIHQAVGESKKTFLDNLRNAQSIMSVDHFVRVSESEHLYALDKIFYDVFGNNTTSYRPSFEEVIQTMNLRASIGLPTPWVSKRQSIEFIKEIYYKIVNHKLNLDEEFLNLVGNVAPLTAAFVRMQITNSGLKVRLVFAVSLIFLVVETYFNLSLKFVIMNCDSTAIHGYTQLEIQKLVTSTNKKHTLCIDYKSFDQKVPSFVLINCALITSNVLNLHGFEKTLFFNVIDYFIRLPVFHPEVPFVPKVRGIPSGSGFTSIFGSIANSYMLHCAIRRYCLDHRITQFELQYKVFVSSDDTIISSDFYIDFAKLRIILDNMFGVAIELESYSKPDETEVFFLGSRWIDNKPTRNVSRMIARIIFGSGNYPKMTDLELFQSRCFEILGNTSQYSEIYNTFGLPYPRRVFRFTELADYSTQEYIKKNMKGKEKRGFFEDIELDTTSSDLVWMTR